MNADLKAAAQQAFNLLDRLPINEGYHDETVEVLDALRAGLAAQAPAEGDAADRIGKLMTDLADAVYHREVDKVPGIRQAILDAANVQPKGLSEVQEPKYTVNGSAIVNRASGEAIPADEPVFIFRARDWHAVNVLAGYAREVKDPAHAAAVWARVEDFKRFWNEHPDRMKAPDTDCAAPAVQTPAPVDALREMEARKDSAYEERNRCVALIARMAVAMGLRVAVTKTAIEGWSEDWHGCIYIELPTGQASWHFHDSQAALFAGLPTGDATWDGHDTPEKYRRVDAAYAGGHECPGLRGDDPRGCWRVRCQLGSRCADAPPVPSPAVVDGQSERLHPYGRCTITGPAEDVAFIFRHLPDAGEQS